MPGTCKSVIGPLAGKFNLLLKILFSVHTKKFIIERHSEHKPNQSQVPHQARLLNNSFSGHFAVLNLVMFFLKRYSTATICQNPIILLGKSSIQTLQTSAILFKCTWVRKNLRLNLKIHLLYQYSLDPCNFVPVYVYVWLLSHAAVPKLLACYPSRGHFSKQQKHRLSIPLKTMATATIRTDDISSS